MSHGFVSLTIDSESKLVIRPTDPDATIALRSVLSRAIQDGVISHIHIQKDAPEGLRTWLLPTTTPITTSTSVASDPDKVAEYEQTLKTSLRDHGYITLDAGWIPVSV